MNMHYEHSSAGTSQKPLALPGYEGINRYWDRTHDSFAAKILPGEFYVTTHDELITTVLGSCISACIRDRVFGIGGMNHFMLPHDKSGTGTWSAKDDVSVSTRFGSYAMEHMINDILKHGGHRNNLELKIFGGGRILANMTDVGDKNIRFIYHYIETEGLNLVGDDVGDVYPRKVIYFPRTGKALVKKLRSLHNDTIITREKAYMSDIDKTPASGDVELF